MKYLRLIICVFLVLVTSIVYGQLEKGVYVGRELYLGPGQITSLKDNNGIEKLDFSNYPFNEIKISVSDFAIEIQKTYNSGRGFDSAVYIYEVMHGKVSTNIYGKKYLSVSYKKCLNCPKTQGCGTWGPFSYYISFEDDKIYIQSENSRQKVLLARQ